MAPTVRQRFLPAEVSRELDHADGHLAPLDDDDGQEFEAVSEIVAALYHQEFHSRAKAISECWDRAVGGDDDAAATLNRMLTGVLEDSNYRRLTIDEIEEAVSKELLLPLRLDVDLDDYRELLLFRRGSRRQQIEVRKWDKIRRRQRTVTVDRRLVVHTQVRSPDWFRDRGIDPLKRGLEPDRIDLKHFSDVPRANIKTLLPSVRVRFRLIDSLVMGVPAVASGIVVLTTKLLTTLGLIFVLVGAWLGLTSSTPDLDQSSLVVLIGGLAALGAFLLRQYSKLKNRRVRYLKVLSEHLYFHTIGSGSEVVHTLLYSAKQQEVAEVLLAYRFLLAAPGGLTAAGLDDAVEHWLERTCAVDIDFDIEGAVTKLKGLHLLDATPPTEGSAEVLHARPPLQANAALLDRWTSLFDHRTSSSVPVSHQRDPS